LDDPTVKEIKNVRKPAPDDFIHVRLNVKSREAV
jgi:hypothetical protein